MSTTYLTREGYDRLVEELAELKTTGMQESAKAIAEARDKGDLSENAEYDAAKEAQAMLMHKIGQLEVTIANSRVLDESELDTSQVTILSKVKIKNVKNGMEVMYQLVSAAEADLKQKRISVGSPIGKGLLGKAVGDIAEITTPAGKMEFEILDISL